MKSRENQHQKTKDGMLKALVRWRNEKAEKIKTKDLPGMEEQCRRTQRLVRSALYLRKQRVTDID